MDDVFDYYEYVVAENLEICYYKLKNIRRSEVPQ